MRLRSRAQIAKLRALEAAGELPRGTVERSLAQTPHPERLPRQIGPTTRPRLSNRAPPRPSITRENRRRGR